jgi:hypothetical protein
MKTARTSQLQIRRKESKIEITLIYLGTSSLEKKQRWGPPGRVLSFIKSQ